MHDPRLGRFFSIDPLQSKYPFNSVYAFSENVVINAIELEGLEKMPLKKIKRRNKPRITNRVDGTNFFDRLLGRVFKGKHTTNIVKSNDRVEKQSNFMKDDAPTPSSDAKEDKEEGPVEEPNPLDTAPGLGDGERDVITRYKTGTIIVDYDPDTNEDGTNMTATIVIGINDGKGGERILATKSSVNTDQLQANFTIGNGESLFVRQTNTNSVNISSTRTRPARK
jgi:hypothetical protein